MGLFEDMLSRSENWTISFASRGTAVALSILFSSPISASQSNSAQSYEDAAGPANPVLSVQLEFRGLASELKTQAGTLAFTGLGDSLSSIGDGLSFAGVATDLKPIGDGLEFNGLGNTLKPIGDGLEFQGLGVQRMTLGGNLAFSGMRELKPLSGRLAFSGLETEFKPISGRLAFTGMGNQEEHFDDPAFLYGNWRVEWTNDEYLTPGLITIYSGDDGSISLSGTRVRDNQADWIGSENMAAVADGSYKIEWKFGHLGYWGGESIIRPASPNLLSGRWGYRCEKPELMDCQRTGTSSWARILPSFDQHLPLGDWPDGMFGTISSTPLPRVVRRGFSDGRPIALTAPNEMPDEEGFVGYVHVALYGDDIFGPQNITVQGPTGLTFNRYSYICAFGDGAEHQLHWSQQVCETQGGIDGLYIALSVWSDALPNTYDLVVQGERIPLLLEFEE
jgi:hypothetical protein